MQLGRYLPYLVNRVGQRFVSEFTQALEETGVDVQTWRVLAVLHEHGEMTIGRLSGLTSINFSTLSRLVGRMSSRGLVMRRRDAIDARTVIVAITPAGNRITETLLPQAEDLEARATTEFSEAETRLLCQLLEKLYTGLVEAGQLSEPVSGQKTFGEQNLPEGRAEAR